MPRSIDQLSLIKSLFTALHNIDNLFMSRTQVNITLCNINFCFLKLNNQHSFRITKHRNVCIVCGKYKLHMRFFLSNGSNDLIIYYFVIEIILGLVDEDYIIIILRQYKQYKCRGSLPNRVLS